MIVYWNGKFIDDSEVNIPITDMGYQMGYGVYDTMCTHQGKFMFMSEHMMRVVTDAENEDIPLQLTYEELCEVMRELKRRRIEELGRDVDLRIRTVVTADQYDFFKGEVGGANILIVAKELQKFDQKAVKAVTYFQEARIASSKSTSLMWRKDARSYALYKGAFETIIVDHEKKIVYEGTFTNVFIVKGMQLLTARDTYVLSGIAREEVIDIAHDCMLIDIRDITLEELMAADEVFLTNSVRGIIPVVEVDGKKIGDGKVGSWTKKIEALFWERIKKYRLE